MKTFINEQYIKLGENNRRRKNRDLFMKTGNIKGTFWPSVQFSSDAQLCWTLCEFMNHSTPGLPVHHQLPEFTQTHVHCVGDAILSSVVPFSSHLQSFPELGSFPMSQLFVRMRWPTYWSFSFNISPSNEHPGLISFKSLSEEDI